MEEIIYFDQPNLNKPYLIMGFEGWPNATSSKEEGIKEDKVVYLQAFLKKMEDEEKKEG